MRVVHVTPASDPRHGGPFTALMSMVRAQVAQRHRVSVVATWRGSYPDGFATELRSLGVDVQLIGPAIGPNAWHWQLARTLRQNIPGARIVHIHALWEEIQHQAAKIARELRVPYIITAHGMLDPWSLSQSALRKRIYMLLRLRKNLDRAAAVHFTTETERDLTNPLHLRAPAFVEPYCLDLSEFRTLPARGWLRERIPQIGNRKVVLFLGRLHHKKGIELLLPAFAQAKADDAVLVLAGPVSAEYEAKIDSLIHACGLNGRVFKTGMLYGSERAAALVDAELFVLPSYQENFGIAVVEAMACGTPVIVSDQVNIHAEVTRAQAGAVVPTQVPELSEKLVRWLGDDALRAEASRRARRFAFEEYDAMRSVQRWTEHYARVISNAREQARSAVRAARDASVTEGFVAPEGFATEHTHGAARASAAALARHPSSG